MNQQPIMGRPRTTGDRARKDPSRKGGKYGGGRMVCWCLDCSAVREAAWLKWLAAKAPIE